ncbi:DUF2470 domain-containing protein [Prochlorococcus sp. MIT 1341]|uniref:DUF2470 domain-containing protein n=1 Tax=Prochlorococcus sp. MIT 1341 TaxID=3096221 RepID=UPI002A75DFE5|nr:DUF2470 domain-containing protein [Prochlorococcus sp. MIT 1341]
MKQEPLTNEVSKRICSHMNKDHSDAVIAFAHYYGGLTNVNSATMVSISSNTINIEADGKQLKIPLPHEITDSGQAHRTIVEMLQQITKPS